MQLATLKPRSSALQISDDSYTLHYHEAERDFERFLTLESLDEKVRLQPDLVKDFETAIARAIESAYANSFDSSFTNSSTNSSANSKVNKSSASTFLQRILYRLNRLNLFWYDDLQSYQNERSIYFQLIRDRIESSWQEWELAQLNSEVLDVEEIERLDVLAVKELLKRRADRDLHPPISTSKRYLQEDLTIEGYRLLLAIASLDGLVEASRLSRILGGASNEIQSTLTRVLLEEYGNGRLGRKHSTFFAQMMSELGLNIQPEAYLDIVPWEILASINHNFLLTERKRYFLRYNGGLTYFEIAGPSIYKDYLQAAKRLELSEMAMGYWELHIREDERHGQWMLTDVALPLADRYPAQAWELILGYDGEKFMGDRAGEAVLSLIRSLDSQNSPLI